MRGIHTRTEAQSKSLILARKKLASLVQREGHGLAWKGGLPKCEVCHKTLSVMGITRCNKHKVFAESHRRNISSKCLGIKATDEARLKMSLAKKGHTTTPFGEKHWNWIEDRSLLVKKQERGDSAYFAWRREVWLRDNQKCKMANQDCCGKIEAHHILGWKEHPELRYEVNNGITLCHFHHPRKRVDEKLLSPYFQELLAFNPQ